MHIMKMKSGDLHSVLGEARREHKSNVGDIDEARTHLNYHLSPRENEIQNAAEFEDRIKALGVKRKLRADAVCCLSTILTLPQDYEGDVRQFFEAGYKALVDTLCGGREDYVVQAYVHMDEKTPHMHFVSIPIVEKGDKLKLSAKELLTKSFMKQFHPLVEQEIADMLHMPVHLYSEEKIAEREKARASGDRSKDYISIEEYKAQKQKEAKLETMEFMHNTVSQEVHALTSYKADLGKEVAELNKKDAELKKSVQEAQTYLQETKEELEAYIAKGKTRMDEQAKLISDKSTTISSLEAHIADLKDLSEKLTEKVKKVRREAEESQKRLDALKEQYQRDGWYGNDITLMEVLALLREDGRDELADELQYLIEQEYSL